MSPAAINSQRIESSRNLRISPEQENLESYFRKSSWGRRRPEVTWGGHPEAGALPPAASGLQMPRGRHVHYAAFVVRGGIIRYDTIRETRDVRAK